jgi:predicted phage-related endonuclease
MNTVTKVAVKASKVVVTKIDEFAAVKAEITRLEAVKKLLDAEIKEAFGSGDLLVHHGIEVARLDWRNRPSTDEELLKSAFPEAYAATRRNTRYPVIVNIPRRG